MALELSAFDAAEYLGDPESLAAYLEDALEDALDDGDPGEFLEALGVVARAKGMTDVAREAGVARPALYRSLKSTGHPDFATVLSVLRSLGVSVRISAVPPPFEDDNKRRDVADAKIARVHRAEWIASGRPSVPLAVIRRIREGDGWIRAFRSYRGITQSALAKKAGIGQGYLSEIETSRKLPSPDARAALAKALDIHPLFLSEDAPAPRDGDRT